MHKKKMIAPIIITAIILLYLIGLAVIWIYVDNLPLLIKVSCCIIPLLLVGVCIYVLVERIKEIRSGEEDDLSKY